MRILPFAAACLLSVEALAAAQPLPPPPAQYSYADLADLALAAPLVLDVVVRSAARVRNAPVPSTVQRFYVQADVQALLRGAGGVPPRVSWLVDLPLDARGKVPKLRKVRLLLLAAPGTRPGELRLVAPQAQLAWTPEVEQRLRTILVAAVAPDAPPKVTGVGKAFYVPGSLPGESETQIFLATEDGRPVSLNVLRRPGEAPRWSVALGEMIDDAATPPVPDTLLWYRLACALPAALPIAATAELDEAGSIAARGDYGIVLAGLGPCRRNQAAR